MFTYLNINAFSAFFYEEEPVNLTFPLKNGAYLVSQGRNGAASLLMNYHYSTWSSDFPCETIEKYCTDIVEINSFGFCNNSLDLFSTADFPKNLDKYEIYGETLYSPCDGEIFEMSDNAEDLPPSRNIRSNFGNQIIIKHGDVYVSLNHIKEGSITVEPGSMIKKGQPIAKVGNSGQTTMPHLHIQAYKIDGSTYKGVPILFDGSFPVKSKVYFKK